RAHGSAALGLLVHRRRRQSPRSEHGETQRDGSRYDNLLMISGPASDLWDFKDVPHGTIEQVWYPSPALKQARRRMYVYLPPDYKGSATTYPVLISFMAEAATKTPEPS